MNELIIHCDGGSRGNPGRAAIGIVIFDKNRKQIESHGEVIGTATNNIAEYTALRKALVMAAKLTKSEINIYMDSELVVKQMKGEYKMKAAHLKPIFEKIKSLETNFSGIRYHHVPREDPLQAKADYLVNAALDGEI